MPEWPRRGSSPHSNVCPSHMRNGCAAADHIRYQPVVFSFHNQDGRTEAGHIGNPCPLCFCAEITALKLIMSNLHVLDFLL
eukprot:12414096-Karenia_brevis.AAC.1